MPKKHRLTDAERQFFTLVLNAGMLNPFSDARSHVDAKIGGVLQEESNDDRVRKMMDEISRHIDVLDREGRGHLDCYEGHDRRLVRNAFLFELFYAYRKRFDVLIQEQIRAGARPVKVAFTREAMQLLGKRGILQKNMFELAYQLRRAYYFIDRALVGRSASMKRLRESLWNNVFTHQFDLYDRYLWNRMEDFSTLLFGETGTGKGTAAQAIGRSGFIPFDLERERFVESFTGAFVSLNLSQFSEGLIESELFGHKKGSFTGAVDDYPGVFARCSPHGAIFLDEIGEVSIPVQIKLLNVLQERAFYPVGSHELVRFHGRVIAATNKPLRELREQVFRDDFYYRLCSDQITVPPLRQRLKEDPLELDELLAHTVARLVGNPSPELERMVKAVIEKRLGRDYPWPGNVRELEQCVRRILLTSTYDGDILATSPGSGPLGDALARGIEEGTLTAQELLTGYCAHLYETSRTYGDVARKTGLDRRTVKKYIEEWQGKGLDG